jgi:hypothetical protein
MAGGYAQLRGFVLAHRRCAGPRRTDVSLATPPDTASSSGAAAGRSSRVTPEDADEDLMRTALLAFEN